MTQLERLTMQHWSYNKGTLEIKSVPFYWRLKENLNPHPIIPDKMDFRFHLNEEFGHLEYKLSNYEKKILNLAYKENENIGFLKPGSGQVNTYGASSNNFFLNKAHKYKPNNILEVGCGSGMTIIHLNNYGFNIEGIDPSEYSERCSQEYKFKLIKDFFPSGIDDNKYDMIICNDVYEHVYDIQKFSREVFNSLNVDGVFCIATTNSTKSIEIGDISMLEHQHVNMFTEASIYKILRSVGFNSIEITQGTYGNTLQISAQKIKTKSDGYKIIEQNPNLFFEKAINNIVKFERFYKKYENIGFYVPLRTFGYMATVNAQDDFIFDSNESWHGKYIDGYRQPILSPKNFILNDLDVIFVGSLTFFDDIKENCNSLGFKEVVSIETL